MSAKGVVDEDLRAKYYIHAEAQSSSPSVDLGTTSYADKN